MTDTSSDSRSLGRGMIVAAWVLILGLLAVYFQDYLDDSRNPNQEPDSRHSADGSTEVHLLRNRSGHYVASGLIAGRPVTFLLDTGATLVAVPEQLARRLDLSWGAPMWASTANGTVTAHRTVLPSVSLGAISMTDVPATIMPRMDGDEVLLGMSFLKQLEWRQREGVLTLRHRQ